MTERGEIEVKGKGKMNTYFLVRNKTACENEIMGRPIKDLDSGRESAQSFQEDRAETMPSSHQSGRVNLTYLSLLKQMNVNSFTLNILDIFSILELNPSNIFTFFNSKLFFICISISSFVSFPM